jgi:hypothetical protein
VLPITTAASLEDFALADLGSIEQLSYSQAMEKAASVAKEHKITTPRVLVGFKLNKYDAFYYGHSGGVTQTSEKDWKAAQSEASGKCEFCNVFVVDGLKYKAGIQPSD